MRPSLFLMTFLISVYAFADTRDSLERVLRTKIADTSRIDCYISLAALSLEKDSAKAINYLDNGFKIALKLKDTKLRFRYLDKVAREPYHAYRYDMSRKFFQRVLSEAKKQTNRYYASYFYYRTSRMIQYAGLSKQAIPYLDSAISACPKDSFQFRVELIKSMGRAYYDLGEYQTAMNHYINAKKMYEKTGNLDEGYGRLLHYIGSVFKRQDNYTKALEYYTLEYELAKKIKDESLEAEALYLMASMYGQLKDLDKELEYNKLSLEMYRKSGSKRGEALLLGNISSNYADRGDLKTAIEYCEQAIEIYKTTGDAETKAFVYSQLGSYYSQTGNHTRALELLGQALEIAKRTETKQLLSFADIYNDMAWAYYRMGRYKEAFDNYLVHREYNDSLENENNLKFITEMETKYETEKKEQALALLNKDKLLQDKDLAAQKARQYIYLGIIALMVVMGVVVYRGYRNKKKANRLLEDQFRLINEKNLIIEEKNKDITDSIQYAKRIQEAMLPRQTEMDTFFKESFIFYKPRDIVSGDFYWFAEVGEKAVLAVADCTGHGVPGAFMSIIGQDTLNQLVLEKNMMDPAEILNELDKKVTIALNKKGSNDEYQDGMDIALCVFDRRTRQMEFAGANRPLFVIPDGFGDVIELPGNKFSIGGVDGLGDKKFYKHDRKLSDHDKVYLFSDGYQDQFGGEKFKKFKTANFKKLIISVSKYPLHRQNEVIDDALENWKGDFEQTDDVCVVGVMI